MDHFEFLNSINLSKVDLLKDIYQENEYPAFLVNRGLSYFPDTILYANQMNGFPHLDNKLKYHFLLYSIPKRKRFSKWAKKEDISDTLKSIMTYYKYSESKAIEALSILSEEQIKIIEEKMYKGGKHD